MNIKGLRIGNYLYIDVSKTSIEPVKIELSDLLHINYGYGNYEPIPLTEMWLKMFGFYKENKKPAEKHSYYYSKDIFDYKYCFSYAIFRKDWGLYQEYTDSPDPKDDDKKYFISCGIKYVHQLQNLYFALTGNELTYNSATK